MWNELKNIEKRYNDIKEQLCDPEIFSDNKKVVKLNKELSSLQEIYDLYQRYKKHSQNIQESEKILQSENDEEIIQMAKEEIKNDKEEIEKIEKELKIAMLPKDPNDDKNIFLEIRPAAWWDEAWLFAMELMRMYLRYWENVWWKTEVIEEETTWIWWLKGAIIKISWENVYSKLKFESWVHRVQRVPETESWWRVHTSTITVSIMPEVEDVQVNLNKNDVDLTTYAASSAGWQNANKNQTWVRLIHRPTWIIVNIWEWKSQLQNKERAFQILKARLYEIEQKEHHEKIMSEKANQIWTWDRSEKIRTYNFPQDRITDHRIKKSWSNIPYILEWNIDQIIQELIIDNQTRLLNKNT